MWSNYQECTVPNYRHAAIRSFLTTTPRRARFVRQLVIIFKRRRRANTAMPVNTDVPVYAALPANTAMPMFPTSCETEMHIWIYS